MGVEHVESSWRIAGALAPFSHNQEMAAPSLLLLVSAIQGLPLIQLVIYTLLPKMQSLSTIFLGSNPFLSLWTSDLSLPTSCEQRGWVSPPHGNIYKSVHGLDVLSVLSQQPSTFQVRSFSLWAGVMWSKSLVDLHGMGHEGGVILSCLKPLRLWCYFSHSTAWL